MPDNLFLRWLVVFIAIILGALFLVGVVSLFVLVLPDWSAFLIIPAVLAYFIAKEI